MRRGPTFPPVGTPSFLCPSRTDTGTEVNETEEVPGDEVGNTPSHPLYPFFPPLSSTSSGLPFTRSVVPGVRPSSGSRSGSWSEYE